MYHLLVGRPPFQGTNPVDTLLRVQTEEPEPLRRHDPTIPADVEAIILRCLEKAPQRRYESARALAEDLSRFLDGRPPTLGRERIVIRAFRWLRRHRRLAAAVLLITVAGTLAGGLTLRSRLAAAERNRMAELFSSEVQRIDGMIRVAHLLPLHDIRSDRERVRERMAWIVDTLLRAGDPARPPGWYALGRAHLLLDEYTAAHQHLQAAWDAGYRGPDVAWAYGTALGRLYELQLDRVRSAPDQTLRVDRATELELRDRAVELLRAGVGAEGVPPEYLDGLVACYEGRFQDALDAALQSLEGAPWFYEAWLLQGDVHRELAELALERGSSEVAAEAFRGAEQAYRTAASIAASDPEAHARSCRLWRRMLDLRLADGGADLQTPLENAVDACDRALAVDPRRTAEGNVKAACNLVFAERLLMHGSDPTEAVVAARDAAQRVLEIDPENATGLRLWGNTYSLAVEWWSRLEPEDRTESAEEVAEWTVIAAESLLKAAAQEPEDPGFQIDLGRALSRRAAYLGQQGSDPVQVLDRAREAFERAAELSPGAADPHAETAVVLLRAAERELGGLGDPLPLYGEAIRSTERAITVRPDHYSAHVTNGMAHLGRAEILLEGGSDPRSDLEAAIDSLQRCLSIEPESAPVECALARAAGLLAEHQLAAGEDPTETLILGRAVAERAVRSMPDDVAAQQALGTLLLLSAETSPHRRQRFWWGERAVDLLERLPEEGRDEVVARQIVRARTVVREESGRIIN
jgi:serine/threonine-protein kinase